MFQQSIERDETRGNFEISNGNPIFLSQNVVKKQCIRKTLENYVNSLISLSIHVQMKIFQKSFE